MRHGQRITGPNWPTGRRVEAVNSVGIRRCREQPAGGEYAWRRRTACRAEVAVEDCGYRNAQARRPVAVSKPTMTPACEQMPRSIPRASTSVARPGRRHRRRFEYVLPPNRPSGRISGGITDDRGDSPPAVETGVYGIKPAVAEDRAPSQAASFVPGPAAGSSQRTFSRSSGVGLSGCHWRQTTIDGSPRAGRTWGGPIRA